MNWWGTAGLLGPVCPGGVEKNDITPRNPIKCAGYARRAACAPSAQVCHCVRELLRQHGAEMALVLETQLLPLVQVRVRVRVRVRVS